MVVSNLSSSLFDGNCLQTGACYCRCSYAVWSSSFPPSPVSSLSLFLLLAWLPAFRIVPHPKGVGGILQHRWMLWNCHPLPKSADTHWDARAGWGLSTVGMVSFCSGVAGGRMLIPALLLWRKEGREGWLASWLFLFAANCFSTPVRHHCCLQMTLSQELEGL